MSRKFSELFDQVASEWSAEVHRVYEAASKEFRVKK